MLGIGLGQFHSRRERPFVIFRKTHPDVPTVSGQERLAQAIQAELADANSTAFGILEEQPNNVTSTSYVEPTQDDLNDFVKPS
ncbi:hypothetical protein CSOJ01_12032 [Colletotrichum sojae]|uniref:Uncharacterized protein n=1 Tax=Colletotrichum sojae TaxID=2175907 RepID=A0A8H6IVV2_9PEZI|nr:hypothetical protein CSOJ01_12032 [Colletotrichum sojae]